MSTYSLRCPRPGCGERLTPRFDALGRMFSVCEPCERTKRALCRDCPAPTTDPRALRCAACRATHQKRLRTKNEAKRWADPQWAARRRAQQREYSRRPDVQAKAAAYNRAWIEADPTYMTVAARKYRATAKGRANARKHNKRYAARHAEQVKAYKRAYYARNREAIRARQQAEYRRRRGVERPATVDRRGAA